MCRCVGTVGTHHCDVGIDFLVVTLSCASVHIRGIVGRLAARDRPYAYSYARLVDTRLAPCLWLGGCQFLLFSGYGFCNGGPYTRD